MCNHSLVDGARSGVVGASQCFFQDLANIILDHQQYRRGGSRTRCIENIGGMVDHAIHGLSTQAPASGAPCLSGVVRSGANYDTAATIRSNTVSHGRAGSIGRPCRSPSCLSHCPYSQLTRARTTCGPLSGSRRKKFMSSCCSSASYKNTARTCPSFGMPAKVFWTARDG